MITLEQLVEDQRWNNMTDIQIIKTFFTKNDMEEEGMELIHDLTISKINKLKHERHIVREWFNILPSKYLYENYDLDIADMLHSLELDYLAYGCKLSKASLKWAKENVPSIKMPKIYFRPLLEYLEEQGILFKGQESCTY